MSGLFKAKAPPTPQAPAPIPDNNSPAVLEAQKRAAADALMRSGRGSTILTNDATRGNDSGTDSFSGTKTGS